MSNNQSPYPYAQVLEVNQPSGSLPPEQQPPQKEPPTREPSPELPPKEPPEKEPDRLANDVKILAEYAIKTDGEAGGFLVIGLHGNVGVISEQLGENREIVLKPNEKLHEGELYIGTVHSHPVCVIGDFVLIETERGRIPIKDVRVGDSVLSYGGVYRKVIDKITFPYRGKQTTVTIDLRKPKEHKFQKLTTTFNHPYRIFREGKELWVLAEELRIGDEIFVPEYLLNFCLVCKNPINNISQYCFRKSRFIHNYNPKNPSEKCFYCGKQISGRYPYNKKYCSLSCHMKDAHQKGLVPIHKFDNFNPEFQRKAKLARFKTAKGGSRWERVVFDYLKKMGVTGLEKQYPVQIGTYTTYAGKRTIPRFIFMDIAIPERKIDIEIDGELWHRMRKEEDEQRDKKLEEMGWTVIRIPARQVASNAFSEILAPLFNIPLLADPPINFVKIPILKVETKTASHAHAIGLTIEGNNYDENSVVTNGILTHNTDLQSTGDVISFLADEKEKVMLVTGADSSINISFKTQFTKEGDFSRDIREHFKQKDMLEMSKIYGFLWYRGENFSTELELQTKELGELKLQPIEETWNIEDLLEALDIKGSPELPNDYSTKKYPKKSKQDESRGMTQLELKHYMDNSFKLLSDIEEGYASAGGFSRDMATRIANTFPKWINSLNRVLEGVDDPELYKRAIELLDRIQNVYGLAVDTLGGKTMVEDYSDVAENLLTRLRPKLQKLFNELNYLESIYSKQGYFDSKELNYILSDFPEMVELINKLNFEKIDNATASKLFEAVERASSLYNLALAQTQERDPLVEEK